MSCWEWSIPLSSTYAINATPMRRSEELVSQFWYAGAVGQLTFSLLYPPSERSERGIYSDA